MVIDTSAVIAILFDEPERDRFTTLIEDADRCRMSVVTLVEATMVFEGRKGQNGAERLDRFVRDGAIQVVPVSVRQASLAQEAFRRYGKGSHHPANLNFGDVFAYALAKATGEPLLFKGEDFARTDIAVAAR